MVVMLQRMATLKLCAFDKLKLTFFCYLLRLSQVTDLMHRALYNFLKKRFSGK